MVRKQKQIHKTREGYSKADLEAIQRATQAPKGFNSWTPAEEGDHICGTIVAAKTVKGVNGDFTALTLETPDGLMDIPSSTVLTRELERLGITSPAIMGKTAKGKEVVEELGKVELGHRVAIVYRGSVPGKKGRPARLFTVAEVK